MRNFKQVSVVSTEHFKGPYETALNEARTAQKGAPRNVSYTIAEEGEIGVVTKHEAWGGGNPPYQEIVQGEIVEPA